MMKNSAFNSFQGRIVVIGSSTVGKTSIIKMYTSSVKEFSKAYVMTSGADAYGKMISVEDSDDVVELLFYDTTGLDLYYGTLTKYWMEPDMLLLMYDVTSHNSFDELTQWLDLANSVKWSKNLDSPVVSVLFANKIDLNARRVIAEDAGKEFANKYDLHYFEGSAKTNECVNRVFQFFTEQWYNYCTNKTLKRELPTQKSVFSSFQISDDYY